MLHGSLASHFLSWCHFKKEKVLMGTAHPDLRRGNVFSAQVCISTEGHRHEKSSITQTDPDNDSVVTY